MLLYTHPISQHARRVRILCHELGLAVEEKVLDLQNGEHKSEAFLKINPAGQIPVLSDGGLILPESHAIMRYLAIRDGDDHFYPAQIRPQIDRWLDWTHCTLNPPVQSIAIERFTKGDNADRNVTDDLHERVGKALTGYETAFDIPDVTLADFAIGSTLGLYIMVGGSLNDRPRAKESFEALSSRRSFVETAARM